MTTTSATTVTRPSRSAARRGRRRVGGADLVPRHRPHVRHGRRGTARAARHRPRGRRRRDRRDPRPERLRQVDPAAHRRRPRHALRRCRARSTAASVAPFDARSAVGFQEPRLLPWRTIAGNIALGLPRGTARDAGRAHGRPPARARRARRLRRAPAARGLGRHGAAHLAGARARAQPRRAAARRAVRRARRPDPAEDAGPAARRARGRADHRAARHARRRRGAAARRPGHPARPRRRPAGRSTSSRPSSCRAPVRATAVRPSSPNSAGACSTGSASTGTASARGVADHDDHPALPVLTAPQHRADRHPPAPVEESHVPHPVPPIRARRGCRRRRAAALGLRRRRGPGRRAGARRVGRGRLARGPDAQHRLRHLQPAEPRHQGPGLARGGRPRGHLGAVGRLEQGQRGAARRRDRRRLHRRLGRAARPLERLADPGHRHLLAARVGGARGARRLARSRRSTT